MTEISLTQNSMGANPIDAAFASSIRNAMFQLIFVAMAITTLSGGCRPTEDTGAEIHVLVAASAGNAVTEAVEAFEKQLTKGEAASNIIVVAGPSSGLAQQIESGAPADVFLSASPKWTEALAEHSDETIALLKNRLALATHRLNPGEIQSLADLGRSKVGSIAVAGEAVPIGHYANQILQQFADDDLAVVKSKLVFAKDAGALVAWLERNEVDAAFVYLSDVRRSKDLKLVEVVDETLHDPIVYSIAKINNPRNPKHELRDQFFTWLQSDAAKAIFQRHGFSLP